MIQFGFGQLGAFKPTTKTEPNIFNYDSWMDRKQ